MINLNNLQSNNIIIYVNVDDVEINPYYGSGLFLFGFKNGFSRQYSYVIPNIVTSNSRYTEFEIELTVTANEDPENGFVTLSPSGNWDYKLWAIDEVTLDPSFGVLIDKGQMYLENVAAESPNIVYLSDNDSDKNIVYLTRTETSCAVWSTFPDDWNLTPLIWSQCFPTLCAGWAQFPDEWNFTSLEWDECI